MKKLLSLLSVLTISGTAVPTTIAASPYQKEEKLNRSKRQNNNILKVTEFLNIDWNPKNYFKNLCNIFKYLFENNIIYSISDNNSTSISCDTNYYVINPNSNYNYFVIPTNVEDRGTIELVFRVSDFYLQGFTYNNDFYHFDDSTITNIPDQTSYNLGFDSNYNTIVRGNPTISWTGITQAFNDLINYGENPDSSSTIAPIRGALARVILATAESMRFREVRQNLRNSNTNSFYWARDFYNIITNWSTTTQNAINYLRENRNLINFVSNGLIFIFSSRMWHYLNQCQGNQHRFQRNLGDSTQVCYNNNSNNIKFNDIDFSENIYYLYHTWWNTVKINEYYNISEIQNVVSININSNYKAYYGTLKSVYFQNYNESKVYKIQGIEEPINKIIFDHYDKVYFISTSGNLYFFKEGNSYAEKVNNKYSNPIQNVLSMGVTKDNNFYISTNNGVYYNPSVGWQSTKIGGIEEPINKIVIDTNNNVYFIANSGNAYYLQHNWWTAVKIDTYYNLPQIKNVTDINLTSNNNVYFSTINGVFYNWSAKKIGEIKGLITKIIIDKNDNVYFN